MEIKELIALADFLDKEGKEAEADLVDEMIKSYKTDEEINETKSEPPKPIVKEEQSEQNLLEKLAKTADKLDELGAHKEAELVDEILEKYAKELKKEKKTDEYDWKTHHSQQVRETTPTKPIEQHHVHPYQETKSPSLSTRYCPDHPSQSLSRVGEGCWQCGLDGQVYNWSEGFTTKDGVKFPGSGVEHQTPSSTEYDQGSRVFDSREKILNVIN